jgi:hypothetical protein
MAHAQKPDFVFRRNGRVYLNRRGRQFSRLLAGELCTSGCRVCTARASLCSAVLWRLLVTHSILLCPLHFSRASPCAITFHLDSTTSLTFTNSPFCPHGVFMCFMWITEQTAIVSLYSINWSVFITETECVYCAVRTESASKIPLNLWSVSVGGEFVGLYTKDGRLESQLLHGLSSVGGSVSLFNGRGGIVPRLAWSRFISHLPHLILH